VTSPHNPACFQNHMGLMAVEPRFLRGAIEAIRSGVWKPRAMEDYDGGSYEPPPPYVIQGDATAVVRVSGPMAKSAGKYAETGTASVRRALRAAMADPKVSSVLMVLDSPGGYVAGTQDLADDVAALGEMKPIVAYCEDLCASAAYWVAASASKVYANSAAMVGSIGVFTVIYDSSKAAELAGVTAHLITTGPLKGAGSDGVPVTDEHLAAWQAEVDSVMESFGATVRKGRSMSASAFAKVATGGVWSAKEAQGLGLIDGVKPLDKVLASMPKGRRSRAQAADLAIRTASA
jgi:signal peptide peptidase SppA